MEILIVNDGSKDNTRARAEYYQAKDSRLKVLNKANGGLSDARNHGVDNCNGEYIVFVDGDDYLAPEMIEKLYASITENDADMSICNIQNINEDGSLLDSPSEEAIRPGIHTSDEMLDYIANTPNWFWVVAWNKLYKRSIFDHIRFPKGKIHEDEFFVHQAFDKCQRISILSEKLYYYVQRENSITHKEYKVSRLDVVEAFLKRAEYYNDNGKYDNAYNMLKYARIKFIDGYISLMKNNSKEKKDRVKELHGMYKVLYSKCIGNMKNKDFLLWILNRSLLVAVYTSGNYRHAGRCL